MSYFAEARVYRAPTLPQSTRENILPLNLPSQESPNWLKQYENLAGSIFKYYNVHNEVAFLNQTDGILTPEKKQFYLQENVKRFLSEFVGHVPYSTIPYEIDEKGITYAGMHVMDSYKKAADLGGIREKAETEGFKNIEDEYIQSFIKKGSLPTGVWISPPKIADYGFAFVFIPDSSGRIKEYILRYPEKMNELDNSKKIFSLLSPKSSIPGDADAFLANPLFCESEDPQMRLLTVMRGLGIDDKKIYESQLFEKAINTTLSGWINSYSNLIISLSNYSEGSQFYEKGIQQAKKLLLAIYQKAQEIENNIVDYAHTAFKEQIIYDVPLSQSDLSDYAAALQLQPKLPTTSGGSCPAVQDVQDPFGSGIPFMDNLTVITNLANGLSPEKAKKAESFNCPVCGTEIPSGQGINKCPNVPACGITREEYAKRENVVRCD